ncbi:MAG: VOC family protein [Nocardioidaceae bacterium]
MAATSASQPVAAYKDLCIDAVDATVLGQFWGKVLGLDWEPQDEPPDSMLSGPGPRHRVWINQVPDPVTVKQRVHLDVNGVSVQEYVDVGATPVSAPGEHPWTVMRDPEGGEFCVFVRQVRPAQRLYEVGIDSVDATTAAATAGWWADVLGAHVVHDERGFSEVERIPGAPFHSMDFAPVPEPKTVKNRIHWDVTVAGTTGLDELVARGAAMLRPKDDEIHWHVLADPEGNEFCAFTD